MRNKQISGKKSFQAINKLPPIIPQTNRIPIPPYMQDVVKNKESDFIKNMKRAQSIMIANKNRKHKNVMRSFIMNQSGRKKQNPIIYNYSLSKRQSTFRDRVNTEPYGNNINVDSVNLSVHSNCRKNNPQTMHILQINPIQLRSYDGDSVQEKNQKYVCLDPEVRQGDTQKQKRDNTAIKNVKNKLTKRSLIKMGQNSTREMIAKETCGWKLGRWEVPDQTLL